MMSRVFVLNEPMAPRLSPSLAAEIGLNESILLLQIEFWISIEGHLRNGKLWTYKSLRNLQKAFPFWRSRDTINNTILSLKSQGLILYTSEYNKRTNDRTRWFAIDEDGCSRLKSLKVLRVKKSVRKSDKDCPIFGQRMVENRTALPETEKEISITYEVTPDISNAIDQWAYNVEAELDTQPTLLPSFQKREKRLQVDPIPAVVFSVMYRVCYRAEAIEDINLLTTQQRGKVASVLGQMQSAGADLGKLQHFEDWWVNNWRSKDKSTNQYQAPRPEQVQEFWLEAMKSGAKPKDEKLRDIPKEKHTVNLSSIMLSRAKARGNA